MSFSSRPDWSPPRSLSLESINSSALSSFDEDIKAMDLLTMPPSINTSPGSTRNGQGEVPFVEWMDGMFNTWKQQRGELPVASPPSLSQTENTLVPPTLTPATLLYEKHERFYLPLKNIHFLVENTLYSVPRAPFDSHSSAFVGKGLAESDPIIVQSISIAHFDHFLSILYPPEYGVYTATTVDEWSNILHLADLWGFQSIRALAIKQLVPIASDIDKIVLGKRYAIGGWLVGAYAAVCGRIAPLTEEEGMRLGVQDVVRIFTVREESRPSGARPLSQTSLSETAICARFHLITPIEASSPCATESVTVVPVGTEPSSVDATAALAPEFAELGGRNLVRSSNELCSDAESSVLTLVGGDTTTSSRGIARVSTASVRSLLPVPLDVPDLPRAESREAKQKAKVVEESNESTEASSVAPAPAVANFGLSPMPSSSGCRMDTKEPQKEIAAREAKESAETLSSAGPSRSLWSHRSRLSMKQLQDKLMEEKAEKEKAEKEKAEKGKADQELEAKRTAKREKREKREKELAEKAVALESFGLSAPSPSCLG